MAIRIKRFQVKQSSALNSIILTPIIDVFIFLLIFFMVTHHTGQNDEELPVKLPSAANSLPMTMEPSELVVNIDASGRYVVQGQTMDMAKLEETIAQSVVDNPINQMVIIRGDKQVALQSVVNVLDLCNKLKVPSYKISTESKSTQ